MNDENYPRERITGTFSYRFEDIHKASFLCQKTKANYKAQLMVNIIIAAFTILSFCSFSVVYGITFLSGIRTPSPAYQQLLQIGFIVWVFLAIVAVLSVASFFSPLARLQIRRSYNTNRKIYEREHELVVDHKSLSVSLPDWKTTLGWTQIERLYEYTEGFLVIYGANQCLVIPKRAFPDEDELNHFRMLVSEDMGKEITSIS